MHRLIFAVALALLLGVISMPAQPVYAATITVNTLADEDTANSACSLREAIQAANSNAAYRGCPAGGGSIDTINFSVTGTINIVRRLPVIQSSIVFQGPGASSLTIQRSATIDFRLFWVFQVPATVEFNDLTIANALVSGSDGLFAGGAIYNETNASMTIRNSVLRDNRATDSGGAIANWGNLTVINTTFSNNDGGERGEGGAIFNFYDATLTVINSTFANNLGRINGGAIHNHGTATITGSTFVGNYAGDDCPQCNPPIVPATGAAISNFPGTLTIENSTISGNTGGAVASAGGTAVVRNSTIVNNPAKRFGGISNGWNGTFNVFNTIIVGNGQGTEARDVYGAFANAQFNIVGSISPSTSATLCVPYPNCVAPANNRVGVDINQLVLSPLGFNGGPTQTHLPGQGSIAINTGSTTVHFVPATDQRGQPRVQAGALDIGAVETDGTPTNTNLLYDGGFTQPLGALWATFGAPPTSDPAAQISNGVLEMWRWQGAQSDAGVYQFNPYTLPAGATLEYSFRVGNRSNTFKTAVMVLRSPNWLDLRICYVGLPPNTPLQTVIMRARTVNAWPQIVAQIFLPQIDGRAAWQFDDLNLQYKPGLTVPGNNVQCPTVSAEAVDPLTGGLLPEAVVGDGGVAAPPLEAAPPALEEAKP